MICYDLSIFFYDLHFILHDLNRSNYNLLLKSDDLTGKHSIYKEETMKSQRETRNYNESDAVFIGRAGAIIDSLATYMKRFSQFDATQFTQAYHVSLVDQLHRLENGMSNSMDRAILSGKTAAVQRASKAALDEMQQAKYFVRKVSHNQLQTIHSFGYDKLTKSRDNREKMLFLFEEFVSMMQKRKDALESAGYPPLKLPQLEKLCKEYEKALAEQREYKREKENRTIERVKQLNELHKELQFIQEVAVKYLFRKEPEIQRFFRLQ